MDEGNQKLLLDVMNVVNKHPISRVFYNSLSNSSSLNLQIVSSRIQNKYYRNISDFLNDIKTICGSSQLHYEKGQYYSASSDYLLKLIQKEIDKKITKTNLNEWKKAAFKSRGKLKMLIENPPVIPNDRFSTGIDPAKPIAAQLPSEDLLKKLVELSNKTVNSNDFDNISSIINFYQPGFDINESPPFDVRKLSLPTVKALMSFMNKKIQKKMQPVPENVSVFGGI